ncbi:pectin acetylesterase-family hydrolase [Nannocystis sp. SCPEA4]|uniref:pectin acetylesterase-family hydrolase n=1 Tax=Nannocystis sp. SCPEA4 TaxID=2996787 RepID=UPI00226E2633|nr:pectin acetylesterase-family hydrolase [Nannocystis sp. SCPEA4]MCY1059706.1 pectin acetylesterase-family hydrolase [Nannocystis sp. SCPEA4]
MTRLASPVARVLCGATILVVQGCGEPSGTPDASSSDTDTAATSTSTGSSGEASGQVPTEGATTGEDGSGGSGSHGQDSNSSSTGAIDPPPPGCGNGTVEPGEACDDGNDDEFDGCLADCTEVPAIDVPPLEWKYVPVPGTQCMNGDTAGFGISLNPDSKNVMIYLEGGGACFNDVCDFSAFNIPFIPPPDGIFNRANPGNPVADWSMIYVPYCTGDIHGGDKDTMLGGQVRHFRGYTNITKYLQQWVPTFADAENVLLTGISAGGFGAGLNAVQVADAFGPGPQMIVIDDSGPPVGNQVIPPCLQQTFRAVWGLDQTILAECGGDCSDPDDFATGVLAHTLKKHPDIRFGLFSNTADTIIRAFMSFGWGNGEHDNCGGVPLIVPADVYEDGLLSLRADYEDTAATYYIGQTQVLYNFGQGHTVLRSPTFWTTAVDGVQVSEWVGQVIAGEVTHVGP